MTSSPPDDGSPPLSNPLPPVESSRRTTLRLEAIPASAVPREERHTRRVIVAVLALLMVALLWIVSWPKAKITESLTWQDIAPPPAIPIHPWRWIVIHHSASKRGDAEAFDREHVVIRGWDGIGYHFVIGNGLPTPVGFIEATYRWRQQSHGAHAGPGPDQAVYNQDGLGVCVVGNFDQDALDPVQERRLVELCAQLIHHVPSLSIGRIIGHRDVPGKATVCPGRHLDIGRLRYLVREEMLRQGVSVR